MLLSGGHEEDVCGALNRKKKTKKKKWLGLFYIIITVVAFCLQAWSPENGGERDV